jgi:hypothetical protein
MISKRCCIWNAMNRSICGKPVPEGNWLWCDTHQSASDKMWQDLTAKYVKAAEPKITTIDPGEYL